MVSEVVSNHKKVINEESEDSKSIKIITKKFFKMCAAVIKENK